jgi:dephospho-CoA kinase
LGRSEETGPVIEIWGLTGGIASGKSTVAKYFADLGIPVIDADQISRALSAEGGAAHEAVLKRFGTTDRAELREIVFKDPLARKDLEAILHPHIVRKSQTELQRMAEQSGSSIVIYEAALLVETGRYKSLKGVLIVESPRETRKKRLISRSGLSEEMAEKILDAQLSDEKRRAVATLVIENTGSLDELREKVRQIALASGWISD